MPVADAEHVTEDVPAAEDVTVTVCATFASPATNVSEPGDTVAVAVSLLTQLTVTSALGTLVSTTVNVSVRAELLFDVIEIALLLAVTPASSTVRAVENVCEVL